MMLEVRHQGKGDKNNFIQWVDVIRRNREKRAEKRREETKSAIR